MHRTLVSIPIGLDGNGWAPVPGESFAKWNGAATTNGPFPPENGYPHLPLPTVQGRNDQPIVTLLGGPPRAVIGVWLAFND